jgi:hypothetical protein
MTTIYNWSRRHSNISVALFMFAIATAVMFPYLLQQDALVWPKSGLGTDFLHYRWSSVYYLRQSIKVHRQFPLWYGQVMGGSPIPGNLSISIFYPIQLLFAILPIPIVWGFTLQTVFHLWIAGLGGYMLARTVVKVQRPAALVGGLAMLLSPRIISNIPGDVSMAYAMMWAPLILSLGWLALHNQSKKWSILTGMALAGQFLLHVHYFYLTFWVIGLIFVYTILKTWTVYRRLNAQLDSISIMIKQTRMFGLVTAVFVGLSAFNLLPFLAYTKYLSRAIFTLSEANYHALSPLMLLTLPIPNPIKFPEWELYVGVTIITFIPLALGHPRKHTGLFWFFLFVFSAIFSVGKEMPLFPIMHNWVPGFNWLRVPARMWYFGTIALILLATLGIDTLLLRRSPFVIHKRWRIWLVFAILLFSIYTILGRLFMQIEGWGADWVMGIISSLGLIISVIAIFKWGNGQLEIHWLVALLIVGVSVDLFFTDITYMTPRSIDEMFEIPEIGLPLLLDDDRFFRIYAQKHEIPDHIVIKAGLETLEGMNSFQFESYTRVVKMASECNIMGFSATMPPCISNEVPGTSQHDAQPSPILLGMLNVKYIISSMDLENDHFVLHYQNGDERLYKNTAVLPRAYGVGTVEFISSPEIIWSRLANIDPGEVAIVGYSPDYKLDNPFFVPAEIIEWHPNNIHISITMPQDGFLVISEVWTPGWEATDNGQIVEVIPTNGALRGIFLEAGFHKIILRFVPPLFYEGLLISILSLILCIKALTVSHHVIRSSRAQEKSAGACLSGVAQEVRRFDRHDAVKSSSQRDHEDGSST